MKSRPHRLTRGTGDASVEIAAEVANTAPQITAQRSGLRPAQPSGDRNLHDPPVRRAAAHSNAHATTIPTATRCRTKYFGSL